MGACCQWLVVDGGGKGNYPIKLLQSLILTVDT